jgi:glutamyl-tRNA reductase
VEDAARCLNGLAGHRVLVIGSGEIAGQVLDALEEYDFAALTVMGRNRARACALAEQHRAEARPLDQLPEAVEAIDAVFSATASPDYWITPETLSARPTERSLLIYDLALPRDVDPAVGDLPGVTLIDLDRLVPAATRTGDAALETDARAAEAIVESAVDGYARWLCELHAVPSIQRLLRISEDAQRTEVERAAANVPPEEAKRLDKLARRLSQRLMNDVINELKRTARDAAKSRNTPDCWRLPAQE